MKSTLTAADVIASVVGDEPDLTDHILRALDASGFDIEVRIVTSNGGHDFQIMCSACLNEPIDVEDIYGPCPEKEESE